MRTDKAARTETSPPPTAQRHAAAAVRADGAELRDEHGRHRVFHGILDAEATEGADLALGLQPPEQRRHPHT